MADLEGMTLDRYQLRQLMGQGGMADVYMAYDPHFERDVAIKIFKREDEDLLRRFVREARLMASLKNGHLMPVFDTGTARLGGSNVYYIVMPLMTGGTLRQRIRRGPLSLKEACQYLRDIGDALDYIHQQGIIHRDIKSSNVLLDADGHCYLADFGIARTATESTQMTSTGNVLGTVDYIAPELFETDTRANERSDYYSLGVLLYEMVTGQLPFTAENQIAVVAMHVSKRPPSPRNYVPTLPPQVELVMMKALEKRPALRYATATELGNAFCRAITAKSVELPTSNAAWGTATNGRLPTQTNSRVPQMPPQMNPMGPMGTRPVPAMTQQRSSSTNYYPAATGQYPAQQPIYHPSPPRRNADPGVKAQARIVTFLAILALIAVIGPMVYVLLSNANPFGPNTGSVATATPDSQATSQAATATGQAQANSTTATAQAQANTTATAQAKATEKAKKATATAQAQAQATATAQGNAAATPGVYQTAIAGPAAYEDPLNNPDNEITKATLWEQSETCAFQPDGYHVSTTVLKPLSGCYEKGRAVRNFAARVDVVIRSGGSGGVFFRMGTNPLGAFKGYLFEVDRNGNYKISVSDNFSTNGTTILRDWTPSKALKPGGEKNTLQIIAKNDQLLFYVNDTFLDEPIQDGAYNTGALGFLATAESGNAQGNVIYSNLRVVKLS